MKKMISFAIDFVLYAVKGGVKYYSWLLFLSFFILVGFFTMFKQFSTGLIVTGMTDQITWELYVANFIFTVHIAAASVLVVIIGYIYKNKHMKELVVFAEIVALVTVLLGLMFIVTHLGRPDRLWHVLPIIGVFNIPNSVLNFDIIVLNGYLILNIVAVLYFLFMRYTGQSINNKLYLPLIYTTVVWGPLIHICTAWILNTMPPMHLWHTSSMPILFLTMAGASGPALMIMIFLSIRKNTKFFIHDEVFDMLSQIIVWSLGILMLLISSEIVTELYAGTEHAASLQFNMFGAQGLYQFVPWFWITRAVILAAFIMLLFPKIRKSYDRFLPMVSAMVFLVVLLEKPVVLVLPAFIPTPLGEYLEYHPSFIEIFNVLFIWSLGAFAGTLLTKGTIGILLGEVKHPDVVSASKEAASAA